MARYKCKVCGSSSIEPLCWKHRKKKAISKGSPKSEKKEEVAKMLNLFFKIWDKRENYRTSIDKETLEEKGCFCFETGKWLSSNKYKLLTTCYHHILEKEKYPEYALLEENIIILHPDVHQLVHQNIDKTPKVKALRQELYEKHLNDILNDTKDFSEMVKERS
jgi:hypothetical protein